MDGWQRMMSFQLGRYSQIGLCPTGLIGLGFLQKKRYIIVDICIYKSGDLGMHGWLGKDLDDAHIILSRAHHSWYEWNRCICQGGLVHPVVHHLTASSLSCHLPIPPHLLLTFSPTAASASSSSCHSPCHSSCWSSSSAFLILPHLHKNKPQLSSWLVFMMYLMGLPIPGSPPYFLLPILPDYLLSANEQANHIPLGRGGAAAGFWVCQE